MRTNTKFVTLVLCAAAGCQDGPNTQVVPVELNDLGITQIEIDHGLQDGERMLTIRGLDANDHEIAVSTLRTGMVLYTPEPDVMAAEWHPGTELTATIAQDSFDSVTPDREPHETALPWQPSLATFVSLRAVATAIQTEAGISFAQPDTGEVAFTAGNCTPARFPSAKGNPTECCEDLALKTTWFKIPGTGLLGNRNYGTYACTTSSGSRNCSGTGCNYGPCYGATVGSSGTSAAAVFHPTSNNAVCGHDPDGTGAGAGTPENYTGAQTLYGAITSTCAYNECCYQPNAAIAIPETGTTCLLQDYERCTASSQCLTGYCGPQSLLCGDNCGLPASCPNDPNCCGDVDDCGQPCKGHCVVC